MSFQMVMGFLSSITLFVCSWWIWKLEQLAERASEDKSFLANALNFSLHEIKNLQDALAAETPQMRLNYLHEAMAMAEKRRDAFEERFNGADKFQAQTLDTTSAEAR